MESTKNAKGCEGHKGEGPLSRPSRRFASFVLRGSSSDLFVLALFTVLSLVMTYPLVCRLSTAVLGPPADNFEYLWKLWWFKHSLLDLHRSPFFAPDVFAPFGYPVALSETTVANTILGLPLTAAFGEVVSYNLLVLASFILSGWGAYRLVREWTADGWAGVFAGVVFAFSPYRFAHLGAGHLPLMGTQWLPLALFCVERLIRGPRRLRWGLALGLSGALLALSSWYYAYLGGLFLALYVLVRAWPLFFPGGLKGLRRGAGPLAQPKPAQDGKGRLLLSLGLALLTAGLLVMPSAWPLLRLAAAGGVPYRTSLSYIDRWSASLADFFLPSGMHPLWGEAVLPQSGQNVHETLLGLGWIALALAVLAWRRRRALNRAPVGLLCGLGLAALVLALGTTLHWAGKPVYVPLPAPAADLFNRGMSFLCGKLALNKAGFYSMASEQAAVVPLPTLLLYLFLPFFNGMRVWARAGLIVNLAVAALGGLGLAAWRARAQSGARRWVTVALLLGACFEFLPAPYAFGWSEVRGQPVDDWLAAQPRGIVAAFPITRTWYGPPLYAQRVHGNPIVYGYGTFVPPAADPDRRTLYTFPSDECLSLLRSWRVRYILVGVGSYGDEWPQVQAALAQRADLKLVWSGADVPRFHGDRLLHRMPADPTVPVTELISGKHRAYMDDDLVVYEVSY